MDERLRLLERAAQNDPLAADALQRAKERAGRLVWVLQYGGDSVGLDGSIIGIFTNKEAVEVALAKSRPAFRPGFRGMNFHQKYSPEQLANRWTDGYRNIALIEIELDKVLF
jgi:hypothetical protein